MTNTNNRTVNVKITRHELIDLMLLCSVHHDDGKKWDKLHEKLFQELKKHDEKYIDEN